MPSGRPRHKLKLEPMVQREVALKTFARRKRKDVDRRTADLDPPLQA